MNDQSIQDISPELLEVGMALTSALIDEPVELTNSQRAVLARATVADTFDAILTILQPVAERIDQKLADVIADCWAEELRLAFFDLTPLRDLLDVPQDMSTASRNRVEELIRRDSRRTRAERNQIIDDLHPSASEELSKLLPRVESAEEELPEGTPILEHIQRELTAFDPWAEEDDRITSSDVAPNRVYLASISVQGFRGIGQRAVLDLRPEPGLTLIYGANGSGKSSFAEALDVLLTGNADRFRQAEEPEWQSGFVNIHWSGIGMVKGVFVDPQADSPNTDLLRTWEAPSTDSRSQPPIVTLGDNNVVYTQTPLTTNTVRDFRRQLRHEPVAYLQTPDEEIDRLGWGKALYRCRPILARAELGQLFYEGPDRPGTGRRQNSTEFARQILRRTDAGDVLTESLGWAASAARHRGTIRDLVHAWFSFSNSSFTLNEAPDSLVDILRDYFDGDGFTHSSPAHLPWGDLADAFEQRHKDSSWTSLSAQRALRCLVLIAQAYQDGMTPQARNAIACEYIRLVDPFAVMGLTDPREVATEARRSFFNHGARPAIYCGSLVGAILERRLDQFSQNVKRNWSTIRSGSAVRFEKLMLPEPGEASGSYSRRVRLGLGVDGIDVERGVLSQGELHALALSIFLPTLMRPESPFGFAVIDDPVQDMDERAVDGLSQVLQEAAQDLQVIAFTHDKRLLQAVRVHGIDHTLVNVTRSNNSVVQCEIVDDPVAQTIKGARIAAEGSDEDKDSIWGDVGFHCREALEIACKRAARSTIRRAGGDPNDIRALVDNVAEREQLPVRKAMALAIWGDADRMEDVEDYVKADKRWGAWVNEILDTVNALTHENPDKIQEARSTYNGSLDNLVTAVWQVCQTIEKNCV